MEVASRATLERPTSCQEMWDAWLIRWRPFAFLFAADFVSAFSLGIKFLQFLGDLLITVGEFPNGEANSLPAVFILLSQI